MTQTFQGSSSGGRSSRRSLRCLRSLGLLKTQWTASPGCGTLIQDMLDLSRQRALADDPRLPREKSCSFRLEKAFNDFCFLQSLLELEPTRQAQPHVPPAHRIVSCVAAFETPAFAVRGVVLSLPEFPSRLGPIFATAMADTDVGLASCLSNMQLGHYCSLGTPDDILRHRA